jgi:23S rRNA pseudouridine1911/1915/1917 synthase
VDEPPFEILYEDNHCIVIDKPAAVRSLPGRRGNARSRRQTLPKHKYHKPGNVFPASSTVSTSPSPVFCCSLAPAGSARLSEQFREGTVEKVYWAVVEGELTQTFGTLEDWLRKDEDAGRVEVVPEGTPHAKQAVLHFTRKATHGGLTWLEIRPRTGRTHQLRVQLAHHGHPIYGDAKYGSIHTMPHAIGLHARSLTFLHPVRYEPITVTAEVPRNWRGRFAYVLREGQR